MSGLPREVLKWLQCLDLSYSVRNIRHDISSGYLVAEIISCFYKREIDMHTFAHSTSMAAKRDNWEQLDRIFQKLSLPIQRDEINSVLHRQAGAGKKLVCKLYSMLTGKTLHASVRHDEEQPQPSYAQPTGSYLIKQKLTRDPKFLDSDDKKTAEDEAIRILEKKRHDRHMDRLAQLQLDQPPGQSPSPSLSPINSRKNTNTMKVDVVPPTYANNYYNDDNNNNDTFTETYNNSSTMNSSSSVVQRGQVHPVNDDRNSTQGSIVFAKEIRVKQASQLPSLIHANGQQQQDMHSSS